MGLALAGFLLLLLTLAIGTSTQIATVKMAGVKTSVGPCVRNGQE